MFCEENTLGDNNRTAEKHRLEEFVGLSNPLVDRRDVITSDNDIQLAIDPGEVIRIYEGTVVMNILVAFYKIKATALHPFARPTEEMELVLRELFCDNFGKTKDGFVPDCPHKTEPEPVGESKCLPVIGGQSRVHFVLQENNVFGRNTQI